MGDLAGKDRNHDDQTSFELVENLTELPPAVFVRISNLVSDSKSELDSKHPGVRPICNSRPIQL
jgi:hypothetical protein